MSKAVTTSDVVEHMTLTHTTDIPFYLRVQEGVIGVLGASSDQWIARVYEGTIEGNEITFTDVSHGVGPLISAITWA